MTTLLAGPALLSAPWPADADAAGSSGDGTTAQTEAQAASAKALQTGERVEVVGARDEYSQTFANPDGVTYTLEQSAAPQRVRLADGSFTSPDATLVRRSDGSVGPKAAVLDISFSGGGSGADLVKLSKGGRSLGLGWHGTLPAPVLDGDTATYPDVLPGVDLRMTASVEGFRQTLVVKTREAAQNPDLAKVSFSLDPEGLTAEEGPGGSLRAVDSNGNTVFTAPAGQMWDSATKAAPEDSPTPVASGSSTDTAVSSPSGSTSPSAAVGAQARAAFMDAAAEPSPTASSSSASPSVTSSSQAGAVSGTAPDGDAAPDPAEAPGDGAATAVLPVHLDGDTLSVLPDTQLLQDEGTVYPVYIDPQTGLNESERTVVSSDGDKFWLFSGDMGVGHCGTYNGYYCGSGYTNRMFFEFSPNGLAGKHVLDATFRVTETWSFSCDPTWVDLSRTDNISSSTAWPGPTARDLMVDRYVSAGRGSACDPDQPAKAIEFNDSPTESNENLTPTVQAFADGKWSRLTLRLAAHDETDTNAWKRFKDDASLSVTYVGIPAVPTNVGLLGDGVHRTCETDSTSPETISDPTPELTATAQTAPGGEYEAQLRLEWNIQKKQSDGSWVNAMSSYIERPGSGGYMANGQSDTPTAPLLSEGVQYRMTAWTRSYYGTSFLSSAAYSNCYFNVDTTVPKAPVITLKSPYSECLPNTCVPGGGPGVKATFTFAPNPVDVNTNIVGFLYRMSTSGPWSSLVSGSTGGSFVPPTGGTFVVQVMAKDSLGRPGAIASKQFVVSEGAGPVGQWRFAETSGAAVDSSTTNSTLRDDAALGSAATRDDHGRRGLVAYDAYGNALATPVQDRELVLDGTANAYAATSGPVIDTRASYTISAWARLTDGTRNQTILSQDGVHRSVFYLSYEASLKTWSLRIVDADAPADGSWTYTKIVAPKPAVLGAWTHLTATYDDTNNEILLYVNGQSAGSSVKLNSTWNATGPMQIGRTKWSDVYTDAFKGSIDEVRLWQRTLTPAEIAKEADAIQPDDSHAMALVGSWDPTTATGTSIADTAYGRSLTLSATGASLSGDGGLSLDGATGAATTAGPVIDDSSSFTATAEVKLDQATLSQKPVGYTAQVFGERTSSGSSWGLWYRQTAADPDLGTAEGFWEFGRLNSDGSTFTAVESTDIATMDGIQRLTGTFDSVTGKISFYIGKPQQYTATAYTPAQGAGDLAVGKGWISSSWGHYLPGAVTDLRIWAGAAANTNQLGNVVLGDG